MAVNPGSAFVHFESLKVRDDVKASSVTLSNFSATTAAPNFPSTAGVVSNSITATESGVLTGTTTGAIAQPYILNYVRIGNVVNMYVDGITATATSGAQILLTAVPVQLRPPTAQLFLGSVSVNSVAAVGLHNIATNGVITFTATVGQGNFTNAQQAGVASTTFSYLLG